LYGTDALWTTTVRQSFPSYNLLNAFDMVGLAAINNTEHLLLGHGREHNVLPVYVIDTDRMYAYHTIFHSLFPLIYSFIIVEFVVGLIKNMLSYSLHILVWFNHNYNF